MAATRKNEATAPASTAQSTAPNDALEKRRQHIVSELRALEHAYGPIGMQASRVLDVELVLTIMRRYFPTENPQGAWVPLNGHTFPAMTTLPLEAQRALAIARQRLTWLSGRETWETMLRSYMGLSDPYPMFRIADTAIEPALAPILLRDRTEFIELAMETPPAGRKRKARYAPAGTYSFTEGRNSHEVEIPAGASRMAEIPVAIPPLSGHTSRPPIRVSISELVETGRWMDEHAPADTPMARRNWASSVAVELRSVQHDGLHDSDELLLDGLQHLLGMVGSGKSTLLTVLAVYLAHAGYQVTMVAGDVASLLREQAVFESLRAADPRLHAVPLIGRTTRLTHLQRLHITEALQSKKPALEGRHPAYRSLSLVCPLDGLRTDVRPIAPGNEPCTRLHPVEEGENGPAVQKEVRMDCPLMPVCPVHNPTRALAHANIWLATPASLLASGPQTPLFPESMQYIELVMRHSDVVLVDEADLMQVQFDDRFAPTETLVGDSDGLLDRLASQVSRELYTPGRPLVGMRADLDDWLTDHQKVQSTVNRIYKWLRERPDMRSWLQGTFFYGDRLLQELLREMGKLNIETSELWSTWQSYTRAPLSEYSNAPKDGIIKVTGPDAFVSPDAERVATPHAQWAIAVQDEILHGNSQSAVIRLMNWLKRNLKIPNGVDDVLIGNAANKLLFTLMVVVLDRSLRNTIQNWPVAAEVLDIDRGTGALFYTPSDSLTRLIPEAPMGPVFGFQYVDGDGRGRGTLRFFQVRGVGRDLLYHMHDALQLSHGIAGPHVLLTSGTSWAPGSWKYHLQVGPHVVLLPPHKDRTAQTYCVFEPLADPERPGKSLYASGKNPEERIRALRSMIVALTQERGLSPSRFVEELEQLPESRRRILIVVGSYDEALPVGELLAARMGGPDDVLILRRDPEAFGEDEWRTPKGHLLRSMLNQMPTLPARFLVAPLQAIERGHNILVEQEAAIGSVYFLVRPLPVPYDPLTAVQKMNEWVAGHVRELVGIPATEAGIKLRVDAHKEWHNVIKDTEQYGIQNDQARSSLLWTQLVLVWQCIGRLLRGGVPARVHFVDGKWAPARAGLVPKVSADTERSSMLLGFRQILRAALAHPDPAHREIARALYGSFADALERLGGMLPVNAAHPESRHIYQSVSINEDESEYGSEEEY